MVVVVVGIDYISILIAFENEKLGVSTLLQLAQGLALEWARK